MRKMFFGVLTLGLLAGSAPAISNPALKPSFADSTWYSNQNAVKQQMKAKGYTFAGEINDGGAVDNAYSGNILGIPVNIRHWFNSNNQLTKTTIIFKKTYDTNLYSDWKTVRASIDAKYGQGAEMVTISSTAMQYDYKLESDLQSGKKLSIAWLFPTYNYGIFLDVDKAYTNDNENYLILSYESPNWSKELTRRQQSNDF